MHTPEQLAYIAKHKLVALTNDVDPLYLSTVHGAVTVSRAMELDGVFAAYWVARRAKAPNDRRLWDDVVSNDFSVRNEKMIDDFGCGHY